MEPVFPTAVQPSALCLGTASFGSDIGEAASFAVLDAFVEAGGNFLDTAHIYGAWVEGCWGASERTIGEWLRAHGARDEIVLGTKGGSPPLDNLELGRCSKAALEQDLTESLERLGVDSVDVYWLHRDELKRPVGEIMETLAEFMSDGRIRSCGASNWTVARIEGANAYATEHGLPHFVASQVGWSLADYALDAVPVEGMVYLDEPTRLWHVETGFPLVAFSSQARGYFTVENVEWAKNGFIGTAPRGVEYDSPASRVRLLRAIEIAEKRGCTANQVVLAYLLNQPFPVFPIIGTSNPEHVKEAMAATSVALSRAECRALRG